MAVVVLPTPPFWFATAKRRGSGRGDARASSEPSDISLTGTAMCYLLRGRVVRRPLGRHSLRSNNRFSLFTPPHSGGTVVSSPASRPALAALEQSVLALHAAAQRRHRRLFAGLSAGTRCARTIGSRSSRRRTAA